MAAENKQKTDNDRLSGTISIDDRGVIFSSRGQEIFLITISSIEIIGEMTSQAGPVANDWYLIFVDKNKVAYYVPAYANNMSDFLKSLGSILNCQLVMKLFASTDFNSNIIFPLSLEGHQLLDFKQKKPKNFLEKIGTFLGLGASIEPHITEEVKKIKFNNIFIPYT